MKTYEVKDHAPSLLPDGEWKLVWADEFDGTELDTSKWGCRLEMMGKRHKTWDTEGVKPDGNSHAVFTGRDADKVTAAEKAYREKFPDVEIHGFVLNSVTTENTVDEAGVRAFFKELDKREISVEAVILNAADQGLGMKIFENPLSDFTRVLNTNVIWNYCIAEEAAKRMKARGGSIVFINSNTAYRAIPDRIAYETSKGAQLGMKRGLALDLGKYNIRVNAVLPGMIRTDRWVTNPDFYKSVPSRFTPLGDVADGKDVAEAAYYFVCHARNTTGAELVVDGGNTIQLYPIIH